MSHPLIIGQNFKKIKTKSIFKDLTIQKKLLFAAVHQVHCIRLNNHQMVGNYKFFIQPLVDVQYVITSEQISKGAL